MTPPQHARRTFTPRERVAIAASLLAGAAVGALVLAPGAGAALRGVVLALAAAVAAAGLLATGWWRAARRSKRLRRQNHLLVRAALELQQLRRAQDVHDALPRWLTHVLECTHAEVFAVRPHGFELLAQEGLTLPVGFRLGTGSVIGKAHATRDLVYVPDIASEPIAQRPPGAPRCRSEVALPVWQDGEVQLVVNLEHRRRAAFEEADLDAVRALGRLATQALERLDTIAALRRQRRASAGLADLVATLLSVGDEASAIRATLHGLREVLPSRIRAVVEVGTERIEVRDVDAPTVQAPAAALTAGIDHETVAEVAAGGMPRFVPDAAGEGVRSLALVPVGSHAGPSRFVLALADPDAVVSWGDDDRRGATSAANALGVTLQRLQAQAQLRELLEVVRTLAQSGDPEEVYRRAVDAAVRLVPGADAASILVRDGDAFHFAAFHGYAADDMTEVGAIALEEELRWYRSGAEAFARGEPRLLTGAAIREASAAATRDEAQAATLADAGQLARIQANVCVPITFEGEVTGILNVDSRARADAFGEADMELAEAFAQQVGVIIRQAVTRRALATSVVTDTLTGLGNREGFNRRLALEFAKARRHDTPIHLVMMDIDDFKHINDAHGHHVGDAALQAAGRAMRAEQREEDGLFRWGGDEFALVLVGIDRAEARRIAERHAAAVGAETVVGVPLHVSIGIASYPEDGVDAEALLRHADDLMYQHKHRSGSGSGGLEAAGAPPEGPQPESISPDAEPGEDGSSGEDAW